MLLSEDPATLIRHTVENFNVQPDKQAVARIQESLATLQQARDLRIRECESALKKLARQLNTLNSQHQELLSSHEPDDHAAEIARLDTQKFRVAKAVSDAEMEAERLALQAAELAAKLQELELQGVDGAPEAQQRDSVEDEVLLRLKVYRSLGIEVEREDGSSIGGRNSSKKENANDGGGEFTKAIVRNDRTHDVHVIHLDPKFSKFFYANYFWQTL